MLMLGKSGNCFIQIKQNCFFEGLLGLSELPTKTPASSQRPELASNLLAATPPSLNTASKASISRSSCSSSAATSRWP